MDFPVTRDRFRHDLVARDGNICLVARTNLLTSSLHWEVVVLQPESEKHWADGTSTPAHLRHPLPSEWGAQGWTYTAEHEAHQRYQSLQARAAQTGGSQAE